MIRSQGLGSRGLSPHGLWSSPGFPSRLNTWWRATGVGYRGLDIGVGIGWQRKTMYNTSACKGIGAQKKKRIGSRTKDGILDERCNDMGYIRKT